jgi:hypothetical protein
MRMLAMVLPDITNPFFPEIIRGAEDTAFERGYFLMTANTDEQIGRERRIVAALRSYRVDGILLASARYPARTTVGWAFEATRDEGRFVSFPESRERRLSILLLGAARPIIAWLVFNPNADEGS